MNSQHIRPAWIRLCIALGAGPLLALTLLWSVASHAAPAASILTYPGSAPCNTTLQACINAAIAGDTINVLAGTRTESFTVNKRLTINGAGAAATLYNAAAGQRVVDIAAGAGPVTLTNMTLRDGSNVANGAGINSVSPLVLVNMVVQGNTSTSSGGGIFTTQPITLTNSDVISNSAPNGAGAGLRASSTVRIDGGRFENNVSFNPGGALRADGAIVMNGVLVRSNRTTSGAGVNGGGVRADSTLQMTGGRVENNTTTNDGGGIYVVGAAHISGTRIISNAGNDGGGVFALSLLTVTNSYLDRNRARTGNGGAIYANAAATVTIEGTSFQSATIIYDNDAQVHGGGLFAAGTVRLIGEVAFSSNLALGGSGGALYTAGSLFDLSGTSIFLDVSFWSNQAVGDGGAVWVGGNVNLDNSPEFVNNIAGTGPYANGGGIYAMGTVFLGGGRSQSNTARIGGAIFATGSVFLNVHDTLTNTATYLGGCVYSAVSVRYNSADAIGCHAASDGGAAYSSIVQLSGNGVGHFTGNTAGNAGGLAYATQVEVDSAYVVSNTAGVMGGALYAIDRMTVTATSLTGNRAGISGGALFAPSRLAITGSLFAGNSITNPTGVGGAMTAGVIVITNSVFLSNTAVASGGTGGAIHAFTSVTATNSIFNFNRATRAGAIQSNLSVALFGGSLTSNRATNSGGGAVVAITTTVHSTVFSGNLAYIGGGAISTTVVTVNDATLWFNGDNSFGLKGGAIMTVRGAISGTLFNNNRSGDEGASLYVIDRIAITNSRFVSSGLSFSGSAVYLSGTAQSTIFDSIFLDNADRDDRDGGAIHARNVAIYGGLFQGNSADDGGAIFANSLYLTGATFDHNEAECCGGGGAIRVGAGQIYSSTFTDNYATCCDGGGAIYAYGNLFIFGSTFLSNSVEERMPGGAIAAQSYLYVENSAFTNNFVVKAASQNTGVGGAIAAEYGAIAPIEIRTSTFTGNRANDGGAISCDQPCTILDARFEDNVADRPDTITFSNIGHGGAVAGRGNFTLRRSLFLNNRAGNGGGALYLNLLGGLGQTATIENSLFAGNVVDNNVLGDQGAALYLTGTVNTAKLLHNTISGSTTGGSTDSSAVYIVSGTVSVLDSIVNGYTTALALAGGSLFENANLFHNVAFSGTGAISHGPVTVSGDPRFLNPAAGEYHILASSPARNAGIDVLLIEDFEKQPRPQDGGFDIGFDEGGITQAPVITSQPITSAVAGQSYSYAVAAMGAPAPTFSLAVAPAGMSINPVTGLIQFTPPAAGQYGVTVQASNGVNPAAAQSFTLIVNVAPIITSQPITSAVAGQPYSYAVAATGAPAPTFSLTVAPTGMSINLATGLIQFTPPAAGQYAVTVEASNGVNPAAAQSFTLLVNAAPIITSQPLSSAVAGQAYSYDVEATGTPAPTFSLVVAPAGMSINPITGLIQFTPPAAGQFGVAVQASNGVNPAATQSFTITAGLAGAAPLITSQPVMGGVAGQPYSYDVEATGTPAPTFSLPVAPAGMTVNAATGLIQFTPPAAGQYGVTVQASNGVNPAATQTFTITAGVAGAAPLITSQPVMGGVAGRPYSYDVEATGTPAPTFSLPVAPAGMTVNAATGLIQFTPPAGGQYGVTVQAFNGVNPAATQSFTISVVAAPSNTGAVTGTVFLDQNGNDAMDAGEGTAGITVTLTNESVGLAGGEAPAMAGSSDLVRTAVTAAGGAFVFADVPAGVYRLLVSGAAGFLGNSVDAVAVTGGATTTVTPVKLETAVIELFLPVVFQ